MTAIRKVERIHKPMPGKYNGHLEAVTTKPVNRRNPESSSEFSRMFENELVKGEWDSMKKETVTKVLISLKSEDDGEVNKAIDLAVGAVEIVKKLCDRNMTLDTLENYIKFEDECVKKGFTFKSLLEARDKAEAGELKKPEFGPFQYKGLCPVCNNGILQVENYCSQCGKKIKKL